MLQSKDLLNVVQVGSRVGLTQARIYERMRAGTFPKGQKFGSSRLWSEQEINNWIEQNKKEEN